MLVQSRNWRNSVLTLCRLAFQKVQIPSSLKNLHGLLHGGKLGNSLGQQECIQILTETQEDPLLAVNITLIQETKKLNENTKYL